jgi:hypothetical protein
MYFKCNVLKLGAYAQTLEIAADSDIYILRYVPHFFLYWSLSVSYIYQLQNINYDGRTRTELTFLITGFTA